MDEVTTTDVSSSTPSTSESVSAGSTAAPGSTGETSAPASSATAQQPAPAAPAGTTTQEAEAPSLEIPETDDDLQGQENNPHVPAVINLRGQVRQLSQDLKTFKGRESDLSLIDGLYGAATDNQGNVRYDENTGLPMPSTAGFVSQLSESSPALVDQLFMDIANSMQSDGRAYAAHFFESLGLNVNDIQKYAEMSANPQNVTSIQGGVITAEEIGVIPEHLQDIYRTLSPEDRQFAQTIVDDAQLERYLKNQERLTKFDQFEQKYEADQQAAAKRETDQFWNGVKQKQGEFKAQLWGEGLNSISQGIAEKVTFSSDPAINAVQTAAVKSLVSIIADPNHSQVAAELAQALGVNLDSAFMQSLEAIGTHADNFVKLQQIAANPNMKAHRNDAHMKQAQAEMDSKYRTAMTKFNEVALKIAQAIAGGNQTLREATSEQLRAAKGRPTVGGGARPAGNGAGAEKNPYQPFTKEALAWNQQRRGQLGQ